MSRPTRNKGIVFIADDEDATRDSAQDLLEDHGYLVLAARNGLEALARMRGIGGPAVAIIDLLMPDMDGWDLIAKMRADADLCRIPVIVVSGQGRAPIQGADRILRKPYKALDLLQAVRDHCR